MAAKKEQHKASTGGASVAIFSLAYVPFVGGAELAVKEITDRMPKTFSFDCFTHKFDKRWLREETVGRVVVHRVGSGRDASKGYYGHFFDKVGYVYRAWKEAERVHRVHPFTAIWALMASYGGFSALLFKLRHPWIPMLLTLQEGDSEGHILKRVGIFYPLWKMIFRKADRVQAISNYLAEFARKHGARVTPSIVPNGVSTWNMEHGTWNKRRKEKHQEIVIITTSRLVSKNGVDILIRAFAELKNEQQKYRLRIVGGGPEEARLRTLARNIGVAERVEFVGQIPPEKISAYLEEADIFARPSRSEGLGSSFLEAMAAGLPIIGTPVGGIPDFLKDPRVVGLKEGTGLFAPVGDYKAVAEDIALLSGNAVLRSAIVKNGKALVAKNYQWDTIAERMRVIFEELVLAKHP